MHLHFYRTYSTYLVLLLISVSSGSDVARWKESTRGARTSPVSKLHIKKRAQCRGFMSQKEEKKKNQKKNKIKPKPHSHLFCHCLRTMYHWASCFWSQTHPCRLPTFEHTSPLSDGSTKKITARIIFLAGTPPPACSVHTWGFLLRSSNALI